MTKEGRELKIWPVGKFSEDQAIAEVKEKTDGDRQTEMVTALKVKKGLIGQGNYRAL